MGKRQREKRTDHSNCMAQKNLFMELDRITVEAGKSKMYKAGQ